MGEFRKIRLLVRNLVWVMNDMKFVDRWGRIKSIEESSRLAMDLCDLREIAREYGKK